MNFHCGVDLSFVITDYQTVDQAQKHQKSGRQPKILSRKQKYNHPTSIDDRNAKFLWKEPAREFLIKCGVEQANDQQYGAISKLVNFQTGKRNADIDEECTKPELPKCFCMSFCKAVPDRM